MHFACEVALEAADHLLLGSSLGGAPGHVVPCRLVPAEADNDDAVEGAVGLAVAAAVDAVALLASRGGVDR